MSKKVIAMLVAIGCGTFALKIMEQSDLNVWLSRSLGGLVVVLVLLLMYKFYVGQSEKA